MTDDLLIKLAEAVVDAPNEETCYALPVRNDSDYEWACCFCHHSLRRSEHDPSCPKLLAQKVLEKYA
jgi:hypothetical protein